MDEFRVIPLSFRNAIMKRAGVNITPTFICPQKGGGGHFLFLQESREQRAIDIQ